MAQLELVWCCLPRRRRWSPGGIACTSSRKRVDVFAFTSPPAEVQPKPGNRAVTPSCGRVTVVRGTAVRGTAYVEIERHILYNRE
jgi:hypothetical protein